MRNPTVRSESSSSRASTSSIRARESASRSSAKLASSVTRAGSISRIWASSSRINWKIASRSGTAAVLWVSAGTIPPWAIRSLPTPPTGRRDSARGGGGPEGLDDPRGGEVPGHPAGVADRRRRRGPVRDHAHAPDAEQHRAAVGVRGQLARDRQQVREQDVAGGPRRVVGADRAEDRREQEAQRALEGLEGDVAGEPVGDDDVDGRPEQVAA